MADLWDDLEFGIKGKVNISDDKKLYAIFMLITEGDVWRIVQEHKKKGKSAGEAYQAFKSEFYHTDFASVVILWDKLYASSDDYVSIEAYGCEIIDVYNRLEELGL